jgi:DNA-binding NarL/FixJ family response regulator
MQNPKFPEVVMAGVRILIADDHEVVRRGVCTLLESHPGWEICGEVGDGREAVEKVAELKPDIVILDIGMPRLNGLEAARQILKTDPRQRILVLTISDSEQIVQEVLKAGARGFLLKSDAAKEVVSAVDALIHDRTYFNSRVGEMVLTRFLHGGRPPEGEYGLPTLTPREREVLQLLAEGQTTKEVAATLHLSVKTAETHRSNLMRKLGLHNVSELVMYAVRNNIVSLGENRAIA